MTAATVTARRAFTDTSFVAPGEQAEEEQLTLAFSFRNVTKQFKDKRVLQGIDLDVQEGQFVAIIGKSGCGKSTLLRLLAGLDRPTSGAIVYGAEAKEQKRTRIMFQEPRLLPWARVIANVEVGLTGIEKGEVARRNSQEILAEVGLADRGGEWPSVLSGGQRQRVALARALVGHPSILALDEPLGALDALTRIEMQQLLERIWIAKKFTAVLVTHDVTEAVALADRVVVIDSGRISLDLTIPVERPRRHASPELAFYERQILDRLYNR
ncbi:ATP-binding cassette domain-containing protein [Phyllobacterium sp. YR531]|uniref:ATP-binding cassette domain-containing protein n=1 Tax=Phyllobacterium sp. YR531 TaxID=1144343 RepID=UPI00026F5225|nr:ATP-binding cassette domain-containing protein [Phyllobacterium sp. YR531]EJN05605.1 ABC-type nitrate/sulfonate/bicarbonate transport system, ATPase component [Phyllobacterium sp. YR531]